MMLYERIERDDGSVVFEPMAELPSRKAIEVVTDYKYIIKNVTLDSIDNAIAILAMIYGPDVD